MSPAAAMFLLATGALVAQVPHVRRMRPTDPRRQVDALARRDRKNQRRAVPPTVDGAR